MRCKAGRDGDGDGDGEGDADGEGNEACQLLLLLR